jgi:hypothetical protein
VKERIFSGKGSRKFWRKINKTKPKKLSRLLYWFGCKLQELEGKTRWARKEAPCLRCGIQKYGYCGDCKMVGGQNEARFCPDCYKGDCNHVGEKEERDLNDDLDCAASGPEHNWDH